ncbi:phage tail assembly chaperone family protein, TAC [Acinetobacter sp. NIPH 2699]|uniref:phage tail assembly chaperone family protein, TAC n=1 Tax=Acinetobacter sp. NIPH 2699 TaxID=2923433 RepID=UPI001F4BB78D|nr:phage tail assembly chaperone family protein, TAC [Acinetobacter sp. NIPH 2699]
MIMKSIKDLKRVTKIGAPVKRTVAWGVVADDDNIDFLREQTGNSEIVLGELVDLEGQVFIKKLSFNDTSETSKAIEWDIDYDNIENSKVKAVDHRQLQAAQLLGSICEDLDGKLFFSSVDDVLCSDPNFINALYAVSSEVNNFSGKSRTKSSQKMNSGASSLSMESVETPLEKPSET